MQPLSSRISQLRENAKDRKKVTVSFSQYSTWVKCPSQWQRQYALKEKRGEPGIHTTFGTAMHKTIQDHIELTHKAPLPEADLTDDLQKNLIDTYKDESRRNKKHYSTPEQLAEFHQQGAELLSMLLTDQTAYFPNKDVELLGFEVPVYLQFFPDYDVWYYGLVDGVFHDTRRNTIMVDDYKTATKPWGYFEKKDETKPRQLVFYREALSQLLGYPVEKVDARFLVFARTLPDGGNRIQEYLPGLGPGVHQKAMDSLHAMIATCFNPDGTYQDEQLVTQPSKFACGFCPFRTNCDDVHPGV